MAWPRLHRSTLVVGTIAALLLVLVNVSGRVVDWQPHSFTTFEHGWPYVYLRRQTAAPPVVSTSAPRLFLSFSPVVFHSRRDALNALAEETMWGIPWLCVGNWRFWEISVDETELGKETPHRGFDSIVLLGDIAAAVLLLAIVVAAWEFRRRRRGSLLRFSLSDMFTGVALTCGVLGWLTYLEREFQRELQITDAASDDLKSGWTSWDETCIAPVWFRSLVGEQLLPEFFWRPAEIKVYPDDVKDANALCQELARLKYVTTIEIDFTDEHRFLLSAIRDLGQLRTLVISDYRRIDEHDVNELTQLKQLRKLVFSDKDEVAPDIRSSLEAELPNCKIVDVHEDW